MSMSTSVLVLSPLRQDSGNLSTAGRLREHLIEEHNCILKDATEIRKGKELQSFIDDNEISMVLGLHAYHAGRHLIDVNVPYALIMGGTDINEFYKDDDKLSVMTSAVMKAKYVVCFSEAMKKQANYLWPDFQSSKFVIIPQAIVTSPSSLSLALLLKQKCNHSLSTESIVFTLVAGIRPVKDPMYILHSFSEWHMSNNQNAILLIIGPVVDREFARKFQNTVSRCPGVYYLGSFPREDTHAIIQQSFAVVNTSRSEGMANSILESMDLGVPVIARDNLGNASLISHNHTGLLFTSPQGCITQMESLILNPTQKETLVKNAKNIIELHHSCVREKSAYMDVVQSMKHQSIQASEINGHDVLR